MTPAPPNVIFPFDYCPLTLSKRRRNQMQLHYINTDTGLFVTPNDVSTPTSHNPVIPIDSPPVLRLCFLDGDGDPYTFTARSTFSFTLTFDGAIVMTVPSGAIRPVDPLAGRIDILPARVDGVEISEGTGQITAVIDGKTVLNDAVLFTTGGDVVLPSKTKPRKFTGLRVITLYEAPSEENVGDYVLYLGPEGLMNNGFFYQCVLSDGSYSWQPETPEYVTAWRWHEHV